MFAKQNVITMLLAMSFIASMPFLLASGVWGQDILAETAATPVADSAVLPDPVDRSNAVVESAVVDPKAYAGAAWPPYLVGGLIGLLSLLTFYFSNKPLGASTSYAEVAGFMGEAVAPKHTRQLAYYSENTPIINWQVMLVLGAVIGGFLAALSGGEFTGQFLPAMWVDRFGADSGLLRTFTAITGGVLMAFGARMAGGCTSGHGISGTLQLAIGSWITAICIFLGGILMAFSIFVWSA